MKIALEKKDRDKIINIEIRQWKYWLLRWLSYRKIKQWIWR